jgi:hypothetical protein
MPQALYVIAAGSRDEAQLKVSMHSFEELMELKKMVVLTPVTRAGRTAFPIAPLWCLTVHKAQGATLSSVAANVLDKQNAAMLYTVMTKVRRLERLFLLQKLAPNLFLTLRFSPHLKTEMERLTVLQQKTKVHLVGKCSLWSAFVPALGDVSWLDHFAVVVEPAVGPSLEPVQVSVSGGEEELCYKKRTVCIAKNELSFPDLQEEDFVEAALAACRKELLHWKELLLEDF